MNVILAILLVLANVASAKANNKENMTGRDVMVKVDNRDDGDTRQSTLKMVLINKAGESRVREIRSCQKDYGKDTKAMMTFIIPADVKGTGYLSWEFDDTETEDNRWLYMPALRKIRRISGSSNDDYFMGSDFTYDDMGDRNVDEDDHKILGTELLEGQSCYKLESIPLDENENYRKKILWVRQDIFMIIKVEYYNEPGLLKILQVTDIEKIDDVWMAKKMVMENFQENHKTILTFDNIVVNEPVEDNQFRPATLKRAATRY